MEYTKWKILHRQFCEFYKEMEKTLSFLKQQKHRNKFLQNDFNKCGKNVFEFHIIEIVQEKNSLLSTEQKYLDQYYDNQKMCYNICSITGSTLNYKHTAKTKELISNAGKGRKHSQETKQKISDAHKGKTHSKKTKQKISLALKERKFSKKTKEKLSQALKKRWENPNYQEKMSKMLSGKNNPMFGKKGKDHPLFGKNRSTETKQKIAKSNSKYYDIKLISPSGEIFGPIFNLTEFCQKHKLSQSNMWKIINHKRKSHKGWKLLD